MKPLKTFIFAAVLASAVSPTAFAAESYKLDPTHTAITWHISHFDFSRPSGKFMNVDGVISLDQQAPEKSSVNVTIPVSEINTGVAKLDEHLKSKDFFDVEAFPTAKFESTEVKMGENNTAKVTGNLTLHGVTKPVTLDVKLNKVAENMMKKQTAGFTATTTLKRSDFGISAYLPGLGDDVTIDIESEANLMDAAPVAESDKKAN